MICSCNDRGWLTGFDDVRFGILVDDSDGIADWTITPVYVENHVPMSNIVVRQYLGNALAKVTWRLLFGCRHHYYALLAKLQQTGTLTVPIGVQSHKGTERTHFDKVYELLANTSILEISDVRHFVDGSVEATVTFARAADPVTRTEVVS